MDFLSKTSTQVTELFSQYVTRRSGYYGFVVGDRRS